jgi:catechol-2,3-dioxygenase
MSVEKLADGRWYCAGPQRQVLIAQGQARGFDFSAFGCRDADGLAEMRARAKSEGLTPVDAPSPLLDKAFSVRDPDGNGVVFGLAREIGEGRGLRGPLQHVTLATFDVAAIENFYAGKLGFLVSDRVVNEQGGIATCFMRSNHEHHTLACFRSNRQGIDHHSYEAGEWDVIRDWADRFAEREIPLMWGPGRHGPGNNLFVFFDDPAGNHVELSAEMEKFHDDRVTYVPRRWEPVPNSVNLWGGQLASWRRTSEGN